MCRFSTPSEYLDCCLGTYDMRHIDDQVAFYRQKRDTTQKALEQKYGYLLAGHIVHAGAVAKSTEINIQYDVDLIIPFKYDAFPNLEEMAKDLYQFFQTEFKDVHKLPPRDQRVSVGLAFTRPGVQVIMDIVPGREIKREGYEPDQFLLLYDPAEKRYFQTNIKRQIEAIASAPPHVRSIIRLLKIWKYHHKRITLKGIVLELLVLRAFKDSGDILPSGLWPQLEMTLRYIRDHIETAKLVDPGNANNTLSEPLQAPFKTEIATAMRNMLKGIGITPSRLTQFFPANPKFT